MVRGCKLRELDQAADAADANPPKASIAIKIAYGMGSVAPGAMNTFAGLVMFFYNQIMGLPATVVGFALSATIFTDAISDVLVGRATDQARTRIGRRHPFMIAAVILTPLAFYARWHPPHDWSVPAMFWYVYLTGVAVNLTFSLFDIPSNALGPELAMAYHDRTVLIGYRWMIGAVTGAAATGLIYGVFLRATPEYPVGQLNAAGYGPLSLAITAMMIVGMIAMILGTWREIPRLHQPAASNVLSVVDQIRGMMATLSNRNFGVAVLSGLISGLQRGLDSGLSLYILTFFWGLPAKDILVLSLIGICHPIVAAMIAPRLSARFGKRNTCMGLFFASIAIGHTPMLLRLLGILTLTPSTGLLIVLAGFGFVAGVFGIGGFIVVSSMIADIVEDVQAKTAERSEGLLMTADSFPNRIMNSISAFLPGLLLAWVAFPARAVPGPEVLAKMTRLAWVYLPLMVTIGALSVAVWAFYRIDEAKHGANLRAIRAV